MPRGNTENLIPVNKRTKDEAREMSKKGGINSGIKRRKMKTAKEYAEHFARALLNKEQKALLKKYIGQDGTSECEPTQMALIIAAIIYFAGHGNEKYTKLFLQLIGEMPASKTEITGAGGAPLVPERAALYDLSRLSHDELAALARDAFKEDKGGDAN